MECDISQATSLGIEAVSVHSSVNESLTLSKDKEWLKFTGV